MALRVLSRRISWPTRNRSAGRSSWPTSTDPRLPIDSNASERALRVATLGRKNFLFVGHDDARENLAGLYSLIATCEAHQVNPVDYLADILLRVQSHPAARIDELLPHNWALPRAEPST